MQFRNNTEVFTSDNEKVGEIDRVVIDPRTKKVTHVVISKGLLFKEDKVVPIDLVDSAKEDRVTLRSDTIDALPEFEERRYIPLDQDELPPDYSANYAMPMYWYPFGSGGLEPYILAPVPPHTVVTERNIPARTVALQEGASVVSADGKDVGGIERVFVDPNTDQAMSFLVSDGLLLKKHMIIPTAWVSKIEQDQVHVVVGSKLLAKQSELFDIWEDLTDLVADQ